jgi:hypothetical protein
MPLVFKALAYYVPESGDVRFTGENLLKDGKPPFAICHIGGDVLTTLGKSSNPEPRELMRVLHKYREVIYEAASAQFDRGVHHPRVTIRDIIL